MSAKVSELAAIVHGRVQGDGDVLIQSVAGLESAGAGDITYVQDEKFYPAANDSKASCVITPEDSLITSACRIEVKRPKLA
jgi:UDP-3-O-[3-hydroxymyristoyl] glucosamine N-acyltransferase